MDEFKIIYKIMCEIRMILDKHELAIENEKHAC